MSGDLRQVREFRQKVLVQLTHVFAGLFEAVPGDVVEPYDRHVVPVAGSHGHAFFPLGGFLSQRSAGRDRIDIAVGREPVFVDAVTAHLRRDDMAGYIACIFAEQGHSEVRGLKAEQALVGPAGSVGEVVGALMCVDILIQVLHDIDAQFERDVVEVVVDKVIHLQPFIGRQAEPSERHFFRILHDAPLLHMGVIILPDPAVAEKCDKEQNIVAEELVDENAEKSGKSRAVIDAGKCGNGMDAVPLPAFE